MNEDEKERPAFSLLPAIRFATDIMGIVICMLGGVLFWMSCGSPLAAVLPFVLMFCFTGVVIYNLHTGRFFANCTRAAVAAVASALVLLMVGFIYALGWPDPFGMVALAALSVVAAAFMVASGLCFLRRFDCDE